jgi:hypothetical protein
VGRIRIGRRRPGIFTIALDQMHRSEGKWRDPEAFQDYVRNNGISVKGTAQHISVQSFKGLNSGLKDKNTMVFRLGSPATDKNTHFALAKVVSDWGDYFLIDDELFGGLKNIRKVIDWNDDKYIPFTVVETLTETSHVNLALASGVFRDALGLDFEGISIPATGRSTYTFEVRPHSGLSVGWRHESGQVEIDSIFIAVREGEKHLVVVEAKSGSYPDSLAKHKLVYPVLAVAEHVDNDLGIIPVYLRVQENEHSIVFYVSECCFPDPRSSNVHVNELVPVQNRIIEIEKNP